MDEAQHRSFASASHWKTCTSELTVNLRQCSKQIDNLIMLWTIKGGHCSGLGTFSHNRGVQVWIEF